MLYHNHKLRVVLLSLVCLFVCFFVFLFVVRRHYQMTNMPPSPRAYYHMVKMWHLLCPDSGNSLPVPGAAEQYLGGWGL